MRPANTPTRNGATNGLGDPAPGQQEITWWENCPNQNCGSAPLATLNDLIDCVDDVANTTTDDLLCQQFSGGWCSPSGAFLDVPSLY